jgi:hypothetical protein
VLDSSVLVAYERMKTPGAYSMHEARSSIMTWLSRDRYATPELVLVVPLARESAADIGAASTALRGEDLEIEHVVWCATGHDDGGDPASRWPVATYWPTWYAGKGVPIIAL